MVVYMAMLGAMAIVGQATATKPAGHNALIVNWITGPLVFAAIAWPLDRKKGSTP
jgi:ACR3 family arsenite efflux pump ArsB